MATGVPAISSLASEENHPRPLVVARGSGGLQGYEEGCEEVCHVG
jgi:hypothetical protein